MSDPVPFGKYTLIERLASGAMADIHRAITRTADGTDLPVVIKKIRSEVSTDPEFLARFVDEARIASMLVHPNIVKVFEWGREDDSLFIAMEYIEGTNLAALMQAVAEQGLRFPPTMGVFIVREALKGLHYAHALKDPYGNPMGLVHQDASPPNIVISSDGKVKLVDFGLAKVASRVAGTRPGIYEGKYGYMAPEVIRRQSVDARADLFSLGVALYEVLTGIKLEGTGVESQIHVIIRAAHDRPPSSIHSDIPVELDQLLVRVMAENPEYRPSSAEELMHGLTTFLNRWDRKIDAEAVSAFLLEVLSGRAGMKKEKVGFAFGEATSAWMARGENIEELVRVPMVAESPPGPEPARPDSLLAESPGAPPAQSSPDSLLDSVPIPAAAPDPGMTPQPAPEPELREDIEDSGFAPPKGRFAGGQTVMAIKEGGLGAGRQFKNLLIVLGVAVVLVAIVVLVVKNLGHKDDAAKPDPVKTEPVVDPENYAGAVQVRTEPEGAIVLVDGSPVEPQGQPPRIMGLRSGTHRVKLIVPGYLPWEGDVVLEVDKPHVIEKKLEARKGNLTIATQPSKALVFVNGKRIGKAPRTLKDVSAAKTYKVVLKQKRHKTLRFEIGPGDWPEDPSADLTVAKKMERASKKRRRR
jgi:eukaryotic-like serine/threonine-protein kinase